MTIPPELFPATAALVTADRVADLDRRLGAVERLAGRVPAGGIGGGSYAPGSVGTAHIAAGSVTTATLAVGSVTASIINVAYLSAISANLGTITTAQVTLTASASSYVGTAAPGATPRVWLDRDGLHGTDGSGGMMLDVNAVSGAVTAKAFLLAGSSGLANITGQVTNTQIADYVVTEGKIATSAIGARVIADLAIASQKLADGAVTNAKVGAGEVSSIHISVGSLAGDRIAINTLDGGRIVGGTIIARDKLQALSIDAAQLAVGAVVAGKLNVTSGGDNLALNSNGANSLTVSPWYSAGNYVNGGATLTRITGDGKYSGVCLEVITPGTTVAQGVGNYITGQIFRAGRTYTMSIWAKGVSGSAGPFVALLGASTGDAANTSVILTALWQRVTVTWTPTADATVVSAVLRAADYAAATYRIGGLKVEEGDYPSMWVPNTAEILPGTVITEHMSAGTINGDRISANTLSVATINGGVLGSVVISLGAGTLYAGTAGGASVEYNASGIKGYDYVNGVRTNTLHISTADGSITATKGRISANALTLAGDPGDNLIVNGSFEEGPEGTVPLGWVPGAWSGTNVYGVSKSAASDGIARCAIPSGYNSIGSRKFPVTPGAKYLIRLNDLHDTDGAPIYRRLGWINVDTTSDYLTVGITGFSDYVDLVDGGQISKDISGAAPSAATWGEWVWTAPAGARWASLMLLNWNTAAGYYRPDGVEIRRMSTIKSASSGARVEIDVAGIRQYDASNVLTTQLDPTAGLRLRANYDAFSSARALDWINAAGTVISYLTATESSVTGQSSTKLQATATGGSTTDVAMSITASQPYGNKDVSIELGSTAGPGDPGYVRVYVPYQTSKILYRSDGTSAWVLATSDARWKERIEPLRPGALARIVKLRPRAFNWRDGKGPKGRTAGLVAQEVRDVIPEAVYGSDDDPNGLTVQHAPVIATLVDAVRELSERVDRLSRR